MHDNRQSSICSGTMYMESFDKDEFNFILEDESSDVDLLTTASDIKSEFQETISVSIRGLGTVNGIYLAEVGGIFFLRGF